MAVGIIKENEILPIIVMVLAFVVTYIYDISVIYVILSCGIIGIIQNKLQFWRKR